MSRAMKDSGIAWIGLLPCAWTVGRIGQLYTERKEKVSDVDFQPLSVTMKGILPQLSTAAKTDAHDDRKLVRKGDFAINSRSDRRGSCGISPFDGSVSLINTILTPRNEMNPGFYNWLFHSTMFSDEFYKWGHGIVDDLWTTNWQDMKSILVPIPPLPEQSRIAAYLDRRCAEIDRVIAATQRTIEEYKKLKQSIITEAVTHGVRGPRKMKDSGLRWLGTISMDFSICKLKRFTDIISKGTTPSDIANEYDALHSIRYLKSENIIENKLSEKPLFTITEFIHRNDLKRSQLSENDILFVIAGASIGKVAVMNSCFLPANTNQAVSFIRIKREKKEFIDYLSYVLQSNLMKKYISLYAVQSAQPNLSMEDLSDFYVPFPKDAEEIKNIVCYLNEKCVEIDRLIESKQRLITELESYKKSVIYEYVTGKREVPECQ